MWFLGIDIAQKTFDATLLDARTPLRHQQFPNTPAGFRALQTWLKGCSPDALHACMEATNVYWEDLAEYLVQQGHTVSVVNPARTKGFAISQLKRTKTDKVDSHVIAQFCERLRPRPWTPPAPEQRQLRDLVRHIDVLTKTRTQHRNRFSTCRNPIVQQSLQRLIDTLEAQQTAMEAQIEQLFQTHPALKRKRALLISIKGIGVRTATKLLAEMYDLEKYENAAAAGADAGVTPAHYESGTSVRRRARLSKVGKATVRGALYWPAMTAMRYNPVICALAERLERKGKPFKVILGAAMRKLLHLAYGVLKNQTAFDPMYVSKSKSNQSILVNQST